MGAGDGLSNRERQLIDATIRTAEQLCRFEFSVYLGPARGEPRAYATQLHNSLVAPARSILIMVDLDARAVEIVTGGVVRRTLDDTQVQLAIAQMQSSFADHDVVGGLNRGIVHLAEHAQTPRDPHAVTG
ncbi:DUF5130 family protein [Nocardioides alkalitolerans]|uniref:DUF5130 family protein n=1 Tax=Nocardioides alkalitolerans TaxID=281714 RepID=UPI0003F928D1|nr:DUF5130 family protein [Nocardioides alkalitolerans]